MVCENNVMYKASWSSNYLALGIARPHFAEHPVIAILHFTLAFICSHLFFQREVLVK
jgi:hypothetical protein